ncbi:MAG TPA: S8 family serine peptidase [Gemmatimonadales bacterium]|nr:S8 family serine peptidase [Gemmatimonadales bacterium]
MLWTRVAIAALGWVIACAPKQPTDDRPLPKPNIDPGRIDEEIEVPPPAKAEAPTEDTLAPMVPPEAAYSHGWMPLASTGVEQFLQQHPTYDGRGVIIGILDTGIDPRVPGLLKTSTGLPKILDLRDFSDEGQVSLTRVLPRGDTIEIGGRRLRGFGRVRALNTSGPYYAGTIQEIPLGPPPASDLNGNGLDSDTLALVVTRATDGWVMVADTDGNGSLAGEPAIHDYLVSRETFGWTWKGRAPRVNIAVNFSPGSAAPRLDLVFDISSHGTHVAGIAAGHDLYGVTGFNGVAPGAQLLGLKIGNSAHGSITVTGSILRAMDYAIKFAAARRLPLVLNLSFGVGNETEGTARIDALVDSVLAVHPGLVFTIAAGNDGPGLSTIGFPGSARRSISVGAIVPGSFIAPDPASGARHDQLAYFSSRGGELAKPDLVTPGVAYSTVPRWSTGKEIEQGTSMASPHAAGLAALLVSGLAQAKRTIRGAAIKQALMVTARPIAGAVFVDEGTGIPEVDQAHRWLERERDLPDIVVRAVTSEGHSAAALHQRAPSQSSYTQRFELIRSRGSPAASFRLRADAPWLTAPSAVTLGAGVTPVDIRYNLAQLVAPGAYTGIVTGWGADSLAGPVFRLVSTVIVPQRIASGSSPLRSGVQVPAGGQLRSFFQTDSARPLQVRVSSIESEQKGLAFLHEPDGMPYRDESARPVGSGEQEAVYEVDGRDVLDGAYEVVVVAPTVQPVKVDVAVIQSPIVLQLSRERTGAVATLSNVSRAPVRAEVGMLVGGGERVETVVASGSQTRHIPFVAPAWARAVVVDLQMQREQWSRFTDFGVTLLDSAGRQIEKKPLNYAFGRLQAQLPEHHRGMPLRLALLPGFATSTEDESWTVRASIRLYADSAVALRQQSGTDSVVTIMPGQSGTARFTIPESPWPLGDGFFPLAVVVARSGGQSWTREGGLPLPNPPIMR